MWNVDVLDATGLVPDVVAKVKADLAADREAPALSAFIDSLTERRHAEFADDRRLIGEFRVRRRGSAFVILAEMFKPRK